MTSREHQVSSPPTPLPQDGLLLQYLRGRNVPCPVCGYNLRDLTTARCPECGRHLALMVGVTSTWSLPWTMAVVCLCLAAGIGLLLVGLTIKEGRIHPDLMEGLLLLATPIAASSLLVLPAFLLLRKRFFRYKVRRQWAIALPICAIYAFAVLAFTLLID